ncbi:MAG TPA: hypothetical protein VGK23_08585 [Methanomassiliicoccales archaeon]|jgi:uncharacterized membrane protein
MKTGRKFEGGYRIDSIRRVKRYLYIVQILIILVFATYMIVAGGGFGLKPFYLSINSFIYFVMIMLLVIAVESFVFTSLEMRFLKSNSTKHHISKLQIRRAAYVIVVCGIVIFVLWAPFITKSLENTMSSNDSLVADSVFVADSRNFYNDDPLGVTAIKTATLESTGAATVFIISEANWLQFGGQAKEIVGQYRINTNQYLVNTTLTVDFPELSHSKYYILAYSETGTPVTITYKLSSGISPTLYSFVPVLALLFIVTYGAWGAYLTLRSGSYSKGSGISHR